ncbi:MAG: DUF1800 domain-containing protein [Planctomycetes bacterium]|nr:DUF1800 domain-containing protein [Planctomycetota bacterium]
MGAYLTPWVPSESRPFDARQAAHLLRRAGFGASPQEIAAAVAQGLEATVDALFDRADDEEAEFQQAFAAIESGFVNLSDVGYVQGWWVHRMLRTRVPLKEKLALFWHGHFATSIHKVEDPYLMHRQIETLRQLGAGSFRDLVLAVAKDPAMLVYLDGQSSTKEHPNENFARELMELFTCGIGHYTEQDVQAAARAFTGWHRQGAEFVFEGEVHDGGRKEFLGQAGKFDGGDIVELLMQQPATPRFIATKLLRFFVTPEPPDALVDEAAQLLDRTQLNIKWFLRTLFLSEYFFSDTCYRRRIASPVEFAVGTARTLGVRISGTEVKDYLSAMGQNLLAPPNVKGWDGEQKWINSSTWPKRLDYARLVAGAASETPFGNDLNISAIVPDEMITPPQVVERLAEVLFQGELPAELKPKLLDLLVTFGEERNPQVFRDDLGSRHDRIRAGIAALLCTPEYHTC